MGELDTHYKRLCRVNEGPNEWKRGFGLLAVVLLGGIVGALLAGPGWTWQVKAATAVVVVSGLAWRGIAETESEGLDAIRGDFKEDILDSLVLELVEAEVAPSPPSLKSDAELDQAIQAMLENLHRPESSGDE